MGPIPCDKAFETVRKLRMRGESGRVTQPVDRCERRGHVAGLQRPIVPDRGAAEQAFERRDERFERYRLVVSDVENALGGRSDTELVCE